MAVYRPKISTVTLSPNPVNINNSFFVSVSVSDMEIVLFKVSKISGVSKAGESVTLNVRKEMQ